MTKQEMIGAVADKVGMTKTDTAKMLDAFFGAVASSLSRGEKVTLTGFGTFEVRQRAARMGRNPQTGAPLHIPATKTPAFKAGKGLKAAVK